MFRIALTGKFRHVGHVAPRIASKETHRQGRETIISTMAVLS